MKTLNDLLKLNPDGNIERNETTFEYYSRTHNPDDLYKSYLSYIKWWKATFGTRSPKFISKSDRLKSVAEWLETGGHKTVYQVQKSTLMTYMGLDYATVEELEKDYERFKKKAKQKD